MKAAVRRAFGGPEVLRLEEVPTPEPAPDEVRLRVRAASINLGDWELLTGQPRWITWFANAFAPRPRHPLPAPAGRSFLERLRAPRYEVLGSDVAGTVDAVGSKVTRFRVGDEVFGDCSPAGFGAFAEVVCAPERCCLVPKPPELTFEQAAALPQAGFIALQAMRDRAAVRPGMRVLVNGAGGGAGTLAVQLAVHYGAEVTGVDGPTKQELMRSLGAAHVFDYTAEDFTASDRRYDAILDMAAHRSLFPLRRSLVPGGLYLLAGGNGKASLQAAFLGPFLPARGGRVKYLLAATRAENLTTLAELCTAGTVRPVIDRCYPLHEAGEALGRVGRKESLGKVLIVP